MCPEEARTAECNSALERSVGGLGKGGLGLTREPYPALAQQIVEMKYAHQVSVFVHDG